MKITLRKHLFVGRDEDHLGVEVGTDGVVPVEISLCWTRHDEHAVAGIVVFGHAQMKRSGDGVCRHGPSRRINAYHIPFGDTPDGGGIRHRVEDNQALHEAVGGRLQGFRVFGQFLRSDVIADAIGCHHLLALLSGHAVLQQFDEHLGALAVAHQEEGAAMVEVFHVILEGIIDIIGGEGGDFLQGILRLLVGLEDHLAVIRSVEIVLAIEHLVEPLVAVGFFPHLGQGDVGIPRGAVVGV